jgi:hypothetical protein
MLQVLQLRDQVLQSNDEVWRKALKVAWVATTFVTQVLLAFASLMAAP